MLEKVTAILAEVKRISSQLIRTAINVGGVLIACDILIKTKFGVLGRCISSLGRVGISGQALTTLLLVVVIMILVNRKP